MMSQLDKVSDQTIYNGFPEVREMAEQIANDLYRQFPDTGFLGNAVKEDYDPRTLAVTLFRGGWRKLA